MTRKYLYVYTRAMMALLVAFFALISPVSLVAQMVQNYPVQLKWHGVETERHGDDVWSYIALESAEYDGSMPVFCQSFPIYDDAVKVRAELKNVKTSPLSDAELALAQAYAFASDFMVEAAPSGGRKNREVDIGFDFCYANS